MFRLSAVFFIWMASTAYALEDRKAIDEAELQDAYAQAWNEADEQRRNLLDRAQHAWHVYRDANCAILGDECRTLMAQERAAELRYIAEFTGTNEGTILDSSNCNETRNHGLVAGSGRACASRAVDEWDRLPARDSGRAPAVAADGRAAGL
jgi:lysozyme inhibitor LprI